MKTQVNARGMSEVELRGFIKQLLKKNMVYRRFFMAVNVVIVLAMFGVLYQIRPDDGVAAEFEGIRIVHRDLILPHATLTPEIRADMFLEGLRIDTSVINPRNVLQSISPWDIYVERYAAKYHVDPDLVRAIIYAESKGNPFVVSRVGAQGLMQLMPGTADSMGAGDLMDPEENIKAGVKYIAWLVKYSVSADDRHLLWAWNAGPGKFDKNIMPGETKNFIKEVLAVKQFLKTERDAAI